MNPLSAVFGAGVAVRNALYDRGLFKARKLARPVVSVGNISVGGSGKTPFVIALGQLLKERNIPFDVLSRGYGRSSVETAEVVPDGSADQFGDEPLLIARKLQVPVFVGADRWQAGLLAEKNFPGKLHLLDDGFQHRGLHRDFEIVIVTASDLEDTLLPVGRLREPTRSLERADAVVVYSGEDHAALPDSVSRWEVERNLQIEETPRRPLVFCGIARPQRFFAQLQELGIKPADTVAFPDHHRYTESNVQRLVQLKFSTGAGGFVTTEKDQVNLGALAGRLQPFHVARLRFVLQEPAKVLSTFFSTLEKRCGCRFQPGHEKI